MPRYDDDRTIWLVPAGAGALRVRRQLSWELGFVAVVVRPDGRVGEFEETTASASPTPS